MVGTPYRAVHCSSATACSVFSGSKESFGYTAAAPCVRHPRFPITIPKQWYKGTGIQSLSFSVNNMVSQTILPLFRIFLWDRVAPLGLPVAAGKLDIDIVISKQ